MGLEPQPWPDPTRAARAPESVWDYPRPPRLEPTSRHLVVVHGGVTIAETTRGARLLETSQAPAYYFPAEDVRRDLLVPVPGMRTLCEWKGAALYLDLVVPGVEPVEAAAWTYPLPATPYAAIRGALAFYPQRVDVCLVDGVRVESNAGHFYGGWITPDVIGPFKGGPGSSGW